MKLATAFSTFVAIIHCISIISAIESDCFPEESKYLVKVATLKNLCIGVTLNSYWVLTAAHCVNGTTAKENYIFQFLESHTEIYTCSGNFIHPNYKLNETNEGRISRENNLALIKINVSKTESKDLFVPLPIPGSEIKPGTVARTHILRTLPIDIDPMYEITEVEILGGVEMQEALNTTGPFQFPDTEIVARYVSNVTGVELEDRSGCPMIVNGKLVGIQTRKGGANYEHYLKVSKYVDWIYSTISK